MVTLYKQFSILVCAGILFFQLQGRAQQNAASSYLQKVSLTSGDSIRASDPKSDLDLPGPSRYKSVILNPQVIQFLVNQAETSYRSLQKLQKFTAPKNRYGQLVSMNLQNVSKPICSRIGELRSQIDMVHKSFYESRDFDANSLLGKYLKTSFEKINTIQNQFCFSTGEMGISELQLSIEALESSWRGSYLEIKKLL